MIKTEGLETSTMNYACRPLSEANIKNVVLAEKQWAMEHLRKPRRSFGQKDDWVQGFTESFSGREIRP